MKVVIESQEDSNLMDYAQRELELAGLFRKDGDYDGMVGECVMQLVAVLSSQGHSGGSAMMTLDAFAHVSLYKPLMPITNDPDEWYKPLTGGVEKDGTITQDIEMWQSKRQPDLFSYDHGQTWYSVDDPRWHKRRSLRAWWWRRHWLKQKEQAGA
jgi:hypothetical protein